MQRLVRSRSLLALATTATLAVGATNVHAGSPEQNCQKGRYAAKAKYDACEEKATAALFGGIYGPKYGAAISKCYVKYGATWAKLQAKASGSSSTCANPRYYLGYVGVVTDRLTGLQWEQKTDDGGMHDKDDVYTWSIGDPGWGANGTAYTSFLGSLNSGSCFKQSCDWRLPTRGELWTILLEAYPCTSSPCIDQTIFGPTSSAYYWSSTTYATSAISAWDVGFPGGVIDFFEKDNEKYVRAVRGGL